MEFVYEVFDLASQHRPALVTHCKLLGLACTSTKPALLESIVSSVIVSQQLTLPYSIVAIDLGIKNFAFVELSLDLSKPAGPIKRSKLKAALTVDATKTVTPTSSLPPLPPSPPLSLLPLPPLPPHAPAYTLTVKSWEKLDFNFTKAYNPAQMATQTNIFLSKFITHQNAFILERQPAINKYSNLKGNYQVVCLEAMMIAMLTMKNSSLSALPGGSGATVAKLGVVEKPFKVISVSPLRISNVFNLRKDVVKVKRKSKKEAAKASYDSKKQSSIDLVEQYIAKPNTPICIPDINVNLTLECNPVLQNYFTNQKKKDDLSDALLIGSAHIQSLLYAKHLFETLNTN